MQVVRGHQQAPAWRNGTAVAIGNFDGVHAGHRALITRARELAGAHDARTLVLTFDPHPSALLSPKPPQRISSLSRRLELLEEAGADVVVIEPFTRQLAGLAPHVFVDDIVIGALGARAIIVGHDFSYGHGRAGTTDGLRAHGGREGIEVAIVPAVIVDDAVASSTLVRAHLQAGELARANRILCRPWDVDGIVVHGAKRGRAIGVPTANIKADSELLVKPGIYAVTLAVEGGRPHPAVASLGTNPTFVEGGALTLEVHVLDFDGNLYGKRVRAAFVARLRDEARFDTVDQLVAQIRSDIDAARRELS